MRYWPARRAWLGLALLLCLPASELLARQIPLLTGPVVDEANLLTPEQQRSLADKLAAYAIHSSHQLQLLIIPTLDGEGLEDFSMRLAENWRIGRRDGTGVIFLIALKERQVRLEVGQGLEGDLTDIQASRIIREVTTPHFKQGNYYTGIALTFSAIANTLGGELSIVSEPRARGRSNLYPQLLFGLIFVLFWIFQLIFGRRAHHGLGGAWLPTSRHGSFGSGGFGGGGLGGGWSGGGGGFSGGGASGRW